MRFGLRQIIFLTGLGALVCSTLGCTISRPPESGDSVAAPQEVIEKVNAVYPTGYIPKHFTDGSGSAAPESGDFDPMAFFDALDALTLKEGYRLDYVYVYDGLGGYPVLYVRPDAQPPFANLEELQASPDAAVMQDYLSFIQPDDTADGYYQYVVFATMAPKFYLFWHANYNDTRIVCTPERIKDIINATGEFVGEMPVDDKAKALLINPTPTVSFFDNQVQVRIVIFTNWGGFYEQIFTISRTAPADISNVQEENLVPYDCGVMF